MSTPMEHRIQALGHYALILIALAWTGAAMYVIVQNERNPVPLMEACPVKAPK